MKRAILLVLALGLMACTATPLNGPAGTLVKYPDTANGVMCYTTLGSPGISCLKVTK